MVRSSGKVRRLLLVAAGVVSVGAALAVPVVSPAGATLAAGSSAAHPDAGEAAEDGQVLAGTTAPGRVRPVDRRLAAESSRVRVAARLTRQLGGRAAGSYLEASGGRLVVNVTDPAVVPTVEAAGARARVVSRSTSQLTAVTAAFDRAPRTPNTSWGVDPAANQVVLQVGSAAPADRAAGLLAIARRFGSAVRVERFSGSIKPQIGAGDLINRRSGGFCSAGFNVVRGGAKFVLTAGHCTQGLPFWTVRGGGNLGPTVNSNYRDGNDFGLIRNDGQPAAPWVTLTNGWVQPITAAADPVVGQSVCKSGATTYVTCGTVRRVNLTITTTDGVTNNGVAEANYCAGPGDSGSPVYSGSTALGIHKSLLGTCNQPGSYAYFQQVVKAMSTYGVSLLPR